MKIYVCVKHVPDSAATITIRDTNQIDEAITFLLNPYDENAVEESRRLKAMVEGAEVVAVTLGKPAAADTLRSAMAMGADRGILISTDTSKDAIITARALAKVIFQDGPPDIIFTGRESIDSEGMQIMYRLGTNLHIPVASNVVTFSHIGQKVRVESEIEPGSRDVMEMTTPCVIGTAKGLNKPSYPTFPDIVKARKKLITTIPLESLDITPPVSGIDIVELRPSVEKRLQKELRGTPDEAAKKLITILKEKAKVI